jgi:hypothetical protein
MRDRRAKRSGLGALHVDVNPLMVIGRIRELVDSILLHREPVAVPEVLADGVLEFVRGFENY